MRNEHTQSKTSPKLKTPGAKMSGKKAEIPGKLVEIPGKNGRHFLVEGGIQEPCL